MRGHYYHPGHVGARMKITGQQVRLFVSTAPGGCITGVLTGERDANGALIAEAFGVPVPKAALDILAERQRQKEVEGWTLEHDNDWISGELAALACLYAMPPVARKSDASSTGYGETLTAAIAPADWKMKLGDRRDELKKAGALVIAEMERLDRLASTLKEASMSSTREI